MKNIYYIYAYIRSKDSATAKAGTPYYIGKGTGSRLLACHGHVNVPSNKMLIIKLETNLTELGAFALERRYIRWYGRKDIGTGILLNRTDGGPTTNGYYPTKLTRAKLSQSNKGKFGKLNNFYGKQHSNESKQKMRNSLKGRKLSNEALKKVKQTKIIKRKLVQPNLQREFINRANIKHNRIYVYNLVNFINMQTKVDIICPTHGIFHQRPQLHLRGNGCPVCWTVKRRK